MECNVCFGTVNYYLGSLGWTHYGRCRHCGMDQEIKIEDAIGVLQDAGAEVEQSEVDKRHRCYKVDYYGEISIVGEVDLINWAMKIKNES